MQQYLRQHQQLLSFLLAGGIAAVANYASRFVFNLWFSYAISITLACIVGMGVAYVLMRRHVFSPAVPVTTPRPIATQMVRFALVNIVALSQTLLISLLLVRYVFPAFTLQFYPEAVAHLIGVLVPVVSSYFGHKLFTFR